MPIAGSEKYVQQKLKVLKSIGLADYGNGSFQVGSATRQPLYLFPKLLPSLISIKNARWFDVSNGNQVDLSQQILDNNFSITLDYAAWKLTRYQSLVDLCIYVDDMESATNLMKEHYLKEGKKGNIAILPRIGDFSNRIERLYLDCIANGGRSTLDAIAVEMRYGSKLSVKGQFFVEDVVKVKKTLLP